MGTKTCLMDTYLFRNPEEVSCLCSIQAHVVRVQSGFTIGLVIWLFKLNKHNNHNVTFSFFNQAVNTICKTIKYWKCKQRDFSPGEDGYRWKPYKWAVSFHTPEWDELYWGSTLPWVHSSHYYLRVARSFCCRDISLIHPQLPPWDHQEWCYPWVGDTT